MLSVTFLLILLSIICKYLVNYIKSIRTGDPNESNLTYLMFSYDFKSPNKNWEPEDEQLLHRKRTRNLLIFFLYLIVFFIFLLLNSFTAHLLEIIVSPKFIYPI